MTNLSQFILLSLAAARSFKDQMANFEWHEQHWRTEPVKGLFFQLSLGFLISLTIQKFVQKFSANSDSGKPPHYSFFCMQSSLSLSPSPCQTPRSLSCPSSTLPFTRASLRLPERLQNWGKHLWNQNHLKNKSPAHLKNHSAMQLLFQAVLLVVLRYVLCR